MEFVWLSASCVLIGILVFALKVSLGCGLSSLSQREALAIACGYFLLSLVVGSALEIIPQGYMRSILDLGVAMHIVLALLLVTAGVMTARRWNQHRCDISRRTFWLLSMPCPACLAATFISCSILAGLIDVAPWKIGLSVGLIFFTAISVISSSMKGISKSPSALGNAMIFVGLFYILSILVIPAYLQIPSSPSQIAMSVSEADTIKYSLFIISLVLLGFVSRRLGVDL